MKPINELFNFSGQVAVVTGGAMGIGFGIVQRLHEAGATVIVADLVDKHPDQTGQYIFKKTDVSNEADVVKLFQFIADQYHRVDIVVNNAGIFPSQSVSDMSVEFWDKVQTINGRGVMLMTREAAKLMRDKKSGCIINIASIDALHPSQIGLSAYDHSKHGVWGFTKNVALELGQYGIRVNAIAPGGIATEGVQALSSGSTASAEQMEKMMQDFLTKIPLRRMGVPDDIATTALFLASDASSYMTGAMIVVDGGVLLA